MEPIIFKSYDFCDKDFLYSLQPSLALKYPEEKQPTQNCQKAGLQNISKDSKRREEKNFDEI